MGEKGRTKHGMECQQTRIIWLIKNILIFNVRIHVAYKQNVIITLSEIL